MELADGRVAPDSDAAAGDLLLRAAPADRRHRVSWLEGVMCIKPPSPAWMSSRKMDVIPNQDLGCEHLETVLTLILTDRVVRTDSEPAQLALERALQRNNQEG